jgi:hypothetical protein
LAAVLALAVAFVAGDRISAHRLDEYLQAARIDLQADGVAIDLGMTPGSAVADLILVMIDRNGDGAASAEEQQAYARQVVGALKLTVDGESLRLRLESLDFPRLALLRQGEGTIRIQARARYSALSTGSHQLVFSNEHRTRKSVYMANVLVPRSTRVSVTGQRRDEDQSRFTIDYSVVATGARGK